MDNSRKVLLNCRLGHSTFQALSTSQLRFEHLAGYTVEYRIKVICAMH